MLPKSHLSHRFLYLVAETANVDFSARTLSNQCLNLIQEAQEKYSSIRNAVARDCESPMELVNMDVDRRDLERMNERRQFDQGGCKPNVTEECKTSFLGFFSYALNLPDDEDLKKCYTPSMISDPSDGWYNDRYNDFLHLMHPNVRDQLSLLFDNAKKSCKFA